MISSDPVLGVKPCKIIVNVFLPHSVPKGPLGLVQGKFKKLTLWDILIMHL
jgi:hypothetical protein